MVIPEEVGSVAGHYDADYFAWQNSLGKVAGSLNAEKFSPFIKPGDDILDFGCGGGTLLAALTAKSKIGVEINPHARAHAAGLGITAVASLDAVPSGSIDILISNHALEHTEQPLEVVRQFREKLRPGGRAVVIVPCERYDTAYVPGNIDQHLYTWSPINLGNLFDAAGLNVVSVERIAHRWPPRVDLFDRLLGRRFCNALCVFYAHLRPKLTQVRIVARKI